jgi:hypothetical protein
VIIFSSPDDEITGTEDIIRKSDVLERIDRIKPWHVENKDYVSLAEFRNLQEADEWIKNQPPAPEGDYYGTPVEYDDESAELGSLHELLVDMPGSDASFAVHEDYMEEYAQEEACSLDNVTSESLVYQYVDWDGVADSLKLDMQYTEFRGNDYWIVCR